MTELDIDRLADYVGGALDGTPEAEQVGALVATDPAWAQAYTALSTAQAAVEADLAAFAGSPEPMPADVAARLDALFAAAPATGRPAPAQPTPDGRTGPPDRPADSRPADSRPTAGRPTDSRPAGGPGRRSRRAGRPRWAVPLTTAAVVAVLGVLGVSTLNRLGVGTQSDSTTAADRGGAAPGSAGALGATGPVTLPGNVQLLASGADYRPDTLPRAPMASIRADTPGTAETQGNEPERHFSTLVVPSELDRLTNPAALSACLSAVRQAYPGTAVLVDFARFNGAAAVVVVVAGVPEPRAGTWAVVVGAACGERGEADERSSARVG